jgi:hypothetical protein
MSRARDNANLGAQAGSGLDASDITTGVLPVGVTGGSGLNAVSPANLASGVLPVGVTGGSGLNALGTVATGTLGSGVTFPANHATNTLVWKITSGDYTGAGSVWNSANVSFSGVNGKAYEISVFYNARNCATASTPRRDIQSALIVHNVTHAEGVLTSAGTLIANSSSGRYLIAADVGAACDYHYINLIGYFECGADDTYYIRVNTNYNSGTDQDIYNYMSATNPAWVIVREFPNLTITAITPPP